MSSGVAELEHGRAAYAEGSWRDAYASLSEADRKAPLHAADLELLARSAYMVGRDADYRSGLERAHAAYRDKGQPLPAIRCAFWIGHNLLFRGDRAQASGWFGRAHRLLATTDEDCAERGYLLIPLWLQQMAEGDYDAALDLIREAAAIGERLGDVDLMWLARDEQGRALIRAGHAEEGLRLVDEVLVAAVADELSPVVTGIVYCNTIAFCQDAYELRHAREWTEALTRWCDRQPEMVAHNGLCLVHRAEIMQLQGAWASALEESKRAAERFTKGVLNELACGKAHYREGEIHRLRGEFGAAETAYRKASQCGCEPQPGLALLRLVQGHGDTAAATIRRSVGETTRPLERAALLPAYVEIMLAVGEHDRARAACDELERVAEAQDTDALYAMAAHARAVVLLAEADAEQALIAARRAATLWRTLGAPYETARARTLVAAACRALGDEDTTALELEAAEAVYSELGAAPDLAEARASLQQGRAPDAHDLTGRELEVLRLVSSGRSNREIADTLVISEHTVARHLQNIFVKLGVSSRTAASAFAYEHDLV